MSENMDVEAWVWSHYTLEPATQKLSWPISLTCLICREEVSHVATESRLADHLKERHMRDVRERVGLEELLPEKPARPRKTEEMSDAWAFFDQITDKSKRPPKSRAFPEPRSKVFRDICKVCGRHIPRLPDSDAENIRYQHLKRSHPHLRINTPMKFNSGACNEDSMKASTIDESEPTRAEASDEFDLMLMASFEAEMKRQLASEKPPAPVGEDRIRPSANAFNFGEIIGSHASRKRASSPCDGGSNTAETLIRGPSTPDDVGQDALLMKMEPEDGLYAANLFEGPLFASSSRSSSSADTNFGEKRRSDVSDDASHSSFGTPDPDALSQTPSLRDDFHPPDGRSFSSSRRSSFRTPSASSSPVPTVAVSVKRRRVDTSTGRRASTTTTSTTTTSSTLDSSKGVRYRRGVIRRACHKLARRCATLWTATRFTDFDREIVFSRRCDEAGRAPGKATDATNDVSAIEESRVSSQATSSVSSAWQTPALPSIKHTIIGSFKKLSRNRFSCLRCAKRFRRVRKLASHMKLVHRSKHFACEVCNRKFFSNSQRLWHELHTHTHRRFEGGGGGGAAAAAAAAASSSSSKTTKSAPNECKRCRLTFRRDYSLKLHKCFVHKRPFRLKAKLISLGDLLEFASGASTSQEPITCCRCDRTFATGDNFEKHRRTCSPVESTEVEESSGYVSPNSVSSEPRQSVINPTESSFVVPPAPSKSINSDSSPYSSAPLSHACPHCIKGYSSFDMLKRHVDACHNAKAILAARKMEANLSMNQACTACDDSFLSTQALLRHFSKRHGDLEVMECDWWSWSRDDDDWVQHSKPLIYHV